LTIERIALLYLQEDNGQLPLVEVDEAFPQRETGKLDAGIQNSKRISF